MSTPVENIVRVVVRNICGLVFFWPVLRILRIRKDPNIGDGYPDPVRDVFLSETLVQKSIRQQVPVAHDCALPYLLQKFNHILEKS